KSRSRDDREAAGRGAGGDLRGDMVAVGRAGACPDDGDAAPRHIREIERPTHPEAPGWSIQILHSGGPLQVTGHQDPRVELRADLEVALDVETLEPCRKPVDRLAGGRTSAARCEGQCVLE